MERGEILRRIAHMCSIVFLVYYIIPDEVFGDLIPGFYKWHAVLEIMIIVMLFELFRLRGGTLFPGLRTYEEKQMSAFAWFALAMGIALLVYEMEFVIPVVIGMAFIDPLGGEMKRRKKKLYPWVPAMVYACIMGVSLYLLTDFAPLLLIAFTGIGTVSAIFAEWWNTKLIDDDFLMIMIPLSALTGLEFLI